MHGIWILNLISFKKICALSHYTKSYHVCQWEGNIFHAKFITLQYFKCPWMDLIQEEMIQKDRFLRPSELTGRSKHVRYCLKNMGNILVFVDIYSSNIFFIYYWNIETFSMLKHFQHYDHKIKINCISLC